MPKWVSERLAGHVARRVKAGQPRAEATDAVLADLRQQVDALLDAAPTEQQDQ